MLQPRLLTKYRSGEPFLNMTLTVLSCAPRVFEIQNFLSPVEIDHIVHLASGVNLKLSGTGDSNREAEISRTRTSRNSWVRREKTPIIDSVYRRAADLLRINEALLRQRNDKEYSDLDAKESIAEQLQLVHYGVGQEYTAHHDFGYRKQNEPRQPDRFATLLLYLNEGMEGGETSFPRWINAETTDALKVVPEAGKVSNTRLLWLWAFEKCIYPDFYFTVLPDELLLRLFFSPHSFNLCFPTFVYFYLFLSCSNYYAGCLILFSVAWWKHGWPLPACCYSCHTRGEMANQLVGAGTCLLIKLGNYMVFVGVCEKINAPMHFQPWGLCLFYCW